MKNRLLPFTIFILTLGFAALLISASITNSKKKVPPKNAKEYIDILRNNQKTGAISAIDELKARQQVVRNDQVYSSRNFSFDWMERGPNNAGGRTRAIIFDNQDETGQTLFAGGVLGGMFKSMNGGNSWSKINAENGNLRITCLAQTPDGTIFAGTGEGFNVETYTVLGDWGYTSGFMGQGLFRSTNGESFELIPSTAPDGENWAMINEIALTQNDRIFAATNNGLKFSGNQGGSWITAKTTGGEELADPSMEVVSGPDGLIIAEINKLCYISIDGNPDNFILRSTDSTYDLPNQGVGRIEFAIPPTGGAIIYALVVTDEGALYNVYRSDDRGVNWYIVGPGGSDNFIVFDPDNSSTSQGQGVFTCEIEVFPENPDQILIGGVDMWWGKKVLEGEIYDWKLASRSNTFTLDGFYLPGGHHSYVFNPADGYSLFIGSNGGIYMGSVVTEEYLLFQSMNKDFIASQCYAVSPTAEEKIVAGGIQDLGTMVIIGTLNPGDALRGNDIWTTASGLPVRDNGGYVAYSIIYNQAAIYSTYPHPNRDGDVEQFVRRNEYGGGTDWSDNMFDDQYRSDAFISPFLLWEEFEFDLSKDSVEFGVNKDYPSGSEIWILSNNMDRPFKYTTPVDLTKGDTVMIQDPVAARFFICGEDQLLMTKEIIQFDVEPEWFVISDEDHNGISGTPQCLHNSADGNHLFVGTLEGGLYRISNIAYAYNYETADVSSPFSVISTQKIPVYLPGTTDEIDQVITSVAVNPNDPNNVIITLGNYGNEHYVYMTNNALAPSPEFKSVQGNPNNGGLPQMPAYSSLIEMDANNNLVIVGTDFGIYISENINAPNPTWISQNKNIGKVPVFMIKQQLINKETDIIPIIDPNNDTTYLEELGNNNYGVIYAATYGRGLIYVDEFQKPVGIQEGEVLERKLETLSIYPNPVSSYAHLDLELPNSTKVVLNIFDIKGQKIQVKDLGVQSKGKHTFKVDTQNLSSGTYVIQVLSGSSSGTAKFVVY